MIAAIFGFMPALDRRLSMAIRSGTAAKVVPNPAIKPRTSERVNLGGEQTLRVSDQQSFAAVQHDHAQEKK